MKPIGHRVGRRGKAKQGNVWDWIKSNMIDTHFFYTGGHRIFNSQQLTVTVTVTTREFVVSLP